jgi:hypothetical protein
MPRYSETERIGVSAIESIVARDLKWIFREQMIADMGIDAHLELVENGEPTGKLVAMQIKTGPGNFTIKDDCLVYYGSLAHREYWLNHSLPVILVAHLPETQETFWVHVSNDNIELTPKNWKISIPRINKFGVEKKRQLSSVFDGSEAQQRFRRLTIDEPLMRHIKKGGKVSVELEDWVNKSLGRSSVVVYVSGEDGDETIEQDFHVFHSRFDVKDLAESLFPWCVAKLDQEFYDVHYEELDDGSPPYLGDEYYESPALPEIYPYANSSNEVDSYRLKLTLNKIGKAYLVLSDYLAKPK